MPADITPKQARSETIENLLGMANLYRVGTGAHTVVINEINRREDWRKRWRNLFFIILSGVVGLVFFLLRG
jgi:uncharacterized membrane protein HdeD (DUF308 family)